MIKNRILPNNLYTFHIHNPKMDSTSSEHSHLKGGPGAIGCKFAEYCSENNLNPDKQIPKVDIKYKIYRVSDFDQKKGTIYVGQKNNQ